MVLVAAVEIHVVTVEVIVTAVLTGVGMMITVVDIYFLVKVRATVTAIDVDLTDVGDLVA